MRAWPLLFLLALAAFAQNALAAVCTTKPTGNWGTASTWSCGHVPLATDTVVITRNISLAANRTVAGVTVDAGATLSGGNRNLTVSGPVVVNGTYNTGGGDLTTNSGGSLTVNAGGTFNFNNGNASISGNVVVNGTLTSGGDAIQMTGAGTTVSGTGTINNTDFEIEALGISLPAGSTLEFSNGAQLRVGNNNTASFTLDGTITGFGMAAGDRLVRVYQNSGMTINGTINAPNTYIRIEQNATITNNGTVSVQYLRTDAATAVWTQGNNSNLTLSMTAPVGDWNGVLNASAAGNTVNYSGAAQTVITPSGAYANLTLSGSGAKTVPTSLTVAENFTMSGTATVAAPTALAVGGDFTIGAGNTFTPGAGTVTLNGAAAQTISGNSPLSFNNLAVTNGANPNITLATNVNVSGTLSGTVTLANTCPTDYTLTSNGGATVAHGCPINMPDHLEIQSSGSGLTCAANTLTIRACADAACATPHTSGVSGTLSATGTPTVNWDGTTGGAAGAGFVIPNGSSSVTKDMQLATAGTVVFGIASPSPVPSNATTCNFGAPSCTFTANTAGFIYSSTTTGSSYTIPAQVSGIATPTLYLRALEASTTNPAVCTPAIISQTIPVSMGYTCNNPASCQSGNLTTINATAVAPGGTAVSLAFDANGSAPLTVRYDDAGQITLNASKTLTPFGGATAITLNGSSNSFVVKPDHFDLSGIQQTAAPNLVNPAAADATGSQFVKAGEQFSVTVTARNFLNAATANFGQETTAESVKLTSALVAPSGGSNPAIGGSFGTFTGGAATGTNFTWGNVGVITVTPSVGDADYLGAGDVTGTTSGNVGRFYPDHFETVVTGPMNCGALSFTPACPSGNYLVYSGQAFSVQVTAVTLAGATTANYTYSATAADNFARTVTLSSVDALGGVAIPGGVGTLSAATAADSTFAAGSNSLALAAPVFSFATAPTAPTNLFIRATDGDGVTSLRSPANTSVEGGIKIGSGRLQIENMYGPPTSRLGTKARALYWSGTQWARNTSDTASGAATGNFALGDTSTCVTPTFCGITLSSATALAGADGEFRVVLTPPTSGSGRRSVLLNSSLSYLAGSGRQTWGSFRAPYIYQRER